MNAIETMIQRLSSEVWLMDHNHFNALLQRAILAVKADRREREAIETKRQGSEGQQAADYVAPWVQREKELAPVINADGIAIIRVQGGTAPKLDAFTKWWFEMSDTHQIAEWVHSAAADPRVRGIFLDIDSPGGSVLGAPELGNEVVAARHAKPVMVFTDMIMASGGYYTAAGASAIYSSLSAIVGSIGSYMLLYDWTGYLDRLGVKAELIKSGKFKGAGAMGTSLTDAQRENFQAGVDRSMNDFRAHVTASRPVKNDSMEGQTFTGKEAVNIGLVDSIASRERAMADLLELANMAKRKK